MKDLIALNKRKDHIKQYLGEARYLLLGIHYSLPYGSTASKGRLKACLLSQSHMQVYTTVVFKMVSTVLILTALFRVEGIHSLLAPLPPPPTHTHTHYPPPLIAIVIVNF